jgi:hypothetical protein
MLEGVGFGRRLCFYVADAIGSLFTQIARRVNHHRA